MSDVSDGGGFSGNSGIVKPGRSLAKKFFLSALLTLIVASMAFFFWNRFFRAEPEGPTQSAPVVISTPDVPESTATLPADDPVVPSDALYRSENFRVGEIAIGGEAPLVVPEADVAPLEILSVRGESFTEKGKNGSKLLITWETNKPAISEISYGKGIGQAEGVIRGSGYETNHSVTIPELAQASTYVYVISGRDRSGNTATSDPYAVYTGAREISLFELIAGAVGDVFGWAVNK